MDKILRWEFKIFEVWIWILVLKVWCKKWGKLLVYEWKLII